MDGEDPLSGDMRFETIAYLGSGANGSVYLVRDNDRKEQVAIKFIQRGLGINKRTEREVIHYEHLLHPHVIQFKEVFLTQHCLAISMEYAAGGSLQKYIHDSNGISETMARWFFQQLIVGLDYIHKNGVTNRDIKLENTLLTDDPWPLVKICDFGLCKSEQFDSDPDSFVGTRPYMAPEVVWCGIEGDHTYDGKKADIWSCGVLLYVMLVRQYPFEHSGEVKVENLPAIYNRMMKEEYQIPEGCMSNECADLIRKILVHDPTMRPGMTEIQEHPWFQISLPEGATVMNSKLEHQAVQSPTEIMSILAEAQSTYNSSEHSTNVKR